MTRWRIFSVLLFVGMLFIPLQAQALDSRCFTESSCKNVRLNTNAANNQEALEGFIVDVQTKEICGETQTINGVTEKMGFCLAAGKAKTALDFAGRNQFRDIADFIAFGYRYTVGLAALIAVLVIIVAGFQWAASAGNQGTISSAKGRIFGAVTGLVIAATSFIILDTINPRLTELRPPNAFLLNEIDIASPICNDLEDDKRVARIHQDIPRLNAEMTDAKIAAAHKSLQAENKFIYKPEEAICGQTYLISDDDTRMCSGATCNNGLYCLRLDEDKKPSCVQGLGGEIRSNEFDLANGREKVAQSRVGLIELCTDGETNLTTRESDLSGNLETYIVPPNKECDETLGYYLVIELKDALFLGVGEILEFNDVFAVGKDPARSTDNLGVCSVNLSTRAYELIDRPLNCASGSEDIRCDCEGAANLFDGEDNSVGDAYKSLINGPNAAILPYLITPEEMANGYRCDIVIDRAQFPELDLGPRVSIGIGHCDEG